MITWLLVIEYTDEGKQNNRNYTLLPYKSSLRRGDSVHEEKKMFL